MRILMLSSLIAFVTTGSAIGEDVVRKISWRALQAAGDLSVGEIVEGREPGPTEMLRVENKDDSSQAFAVLKLDQPGITTTRYALTGRVRYADVEDVGYLEMWSVFADKGEYFSRTLGDSGLMQSLKGSSDWRPFSLPFFSNEKHGPPTRLIVNVVLPGKGTVDLSPLELVQYEQSQDPLVMPGAWWGDRTSGLIGGICGAVFGSFGGLLGLLLGLGKARTFVLTLAKVLLLLGAVSLAMGLLALALGQPYAVWYPLILLGIIVTAVLGANLRTFRRRYDELELRRMSAMDTANAG